MKVLVTGSRGFIGRNLLFQLKQSITCEILEFNRFDDIRVLPELVYQSDVIVHLAGEMRPVDTSDLFVVNVGLTREVCHILSRCGSQKAIILASSIQAEHDNSYGLSKRQAEIEVEDLENKAGTSVIIYRLAHVFGKWCKPNYNSVIATFCHNIARGLPIRIDDPDAMITPVFVDDVVNEFVSVINNFPKGFFIKRVEPEYRISVGDLAEIIYGFKNKVRSRDIEQSEDKLFRALYLTYLSHLPAGDSP
jgi:UDP-2-acetamido-2,6-beta-L-arabino-hexul-4-ose reductase